MHNKTIFSFFCGQALSLFLAVVAVQAMVELDPEFGENGLAFTEIGSRSDEAAAIAVQSDGKIVVAGSSDNGVDRDIALVRYLPDGSVDPEFLFSAGHTIGAAYGDDGGRALALNDDGTILVGGYVTENGMRKGVLLRVLGNGQLDYLFGEQGVVLLDSSAIDSEFHDIALLPDGRIVAAGGHGLEQEVKPLFARFQADGSPDALFAAEGVQTDTSVNGETYGLAVQPDGGLFASGYVYDETGRKGFYLTRYGSNGLIDSSFGDQGQVVVFNGNEEIIAYDIALQPDGRIVVAGEVVSVDGEHRIMIGRFNSAGMPDSELSDNGILVHDSGVNSAAHAVTVLQDGEILASGYTSDSSGMDTVILRFDGTSYQERGERSESLEEATGSAEPPADESLEIINISSLEVDAGSFSLPIVPLSEFVSQAEMITTILDGSDEVSRAITALPDGTVYSAGSSGTEGDSAFMVARYTTVLEGEPVSPVGAVITQYFAIETTPVTGVTRVGALTGGVIDSLSADSDVCISDCEDACTGTDEEIATCKEECPISCGIPTVELRGVVYSVNPHPEYVEGDGSETPDDGIVVGSDDTTDSGSVTDGTGSSESTEFFDFDNYFVKRGQTEDGSGTGVYSSQIEEVNPQTAYYVRSYALLSDGTLIYGNEFRFKTDDSCFIATAAFGSSNDFAVHVLRNFRDRFLKPYDWGQAFIRLYYHLSPPIADIIEQSNVLRAGVILLLLPFVVGAMVMLYTPLLVKCILAGFVVCWYFNSFRHKIWKIA